VMGIRDSIPTPEIFGEPSGDLLIVGWGSTRGAIMSSVEASRKQGSKV
jgi:2-oxoglutarate ferredoxin oxidoreductase subunit alpha